MTSLADAVASGDRRALARAITLVESTRPEDRAESVELLETLLPRTGEATRVGVSGSPGVGKSTLIEALGLHIVASGRRVAVLAVDPSSARTGGSILGDKTRMADLGRSSHAFIRPSPSGGHLGGVARRTGEAVILAESAGFDVVIVETVGVGQSEAAVADMVDTFVLLVAPGGGDELQGVKRGIVEFADLVAVTKADGDLGDAARRAEADYRQALAFVRRRDPEWDPPVMACSALEGRGIGELWDAILDHRAMMSASGRLGARRAAQAVSAMWRNVREEVAASLSDTAEPDVLVKLERQVAAGRATPGWAALEILRRAAPAVKER